MVPLAYLQELTDLLAPGLRLAGSGSPTQRDPAVHTEIDGQQIHYLHVRSPEPDALPLLINHGYPSSVVEFLDLIGPLSDPRSSRRRSRRRV